MQEPWTVEGKVAIVTGSNTGLGRVTAMELARRGAHVFLASRSEERTVPVVEEARRYAGHDRVEYLPLDLASLVSVRRAADLFQERDLPLHLLVNNAGLAARRGLTENGFQVTFGVNYLGHYLLTALLMGLMERSAPARIVQVSSDMHFRASGIDWDRLLRPGRLPGIGEYAVSKLAMILWNRELARRLADRGITTYAVHPGAVATDIYRMVPKPLRVIMSATMHSPEEGARPQLRCAIDPALAVESGLYYTQEGVRTPSPVAQDDELAAELWARSAGWVGAFT